MIAITVKNIEAELVSASMQQPVLLDIWAPWCAPCKALAPVLEKLEKEYAGRFKLAKLNSDEQPEIAGQLSQMFGVRSIPFCVLFSGGQPVDGFVGALPESQVRQFLDKHVPSESAMEAEAELQEAEAELAEGNEDAALAKLQQALAMDPTNETARIDYVKLLLDLGRAADARRAFEPVAGRAPGDARLAALAQAVEAFEQAAQARRPEELAAAIAANKRDFAARHELAQVLLAAGQRTEALDELLEILMRDKAWNEGQARKLYVAILELMTKPAPKAVAETKSTLEVTGKSTAAPSDPVVDQYRRRLSMVIF
jgi:putative thioredoxin